jgi:hypothetical protein
MGEKIFRVQAHVLGLFFDEMVNTFDPDALIVGTVCLKPVRNFSAGFSRKSVWDAKPAGGAGKYSYPRDAERRHGRCARRCLGGAKTCEAKRARLAGGASKKRAIRAHAGFHCDSFDARHRGSDFMGTEPAPSFVEGI